MNENESKRYLITYEDESVSCEQATKILGLAKNKCKEGVAFMASDAIPSKDDVLHFESLGISTIELNAEEAKKISQSKGVLAVEEDVEMFALGAPENDEEQFRELFMNSEEMVEFSETDQTQDFDQGYDQALIDVFANLLKARNKPGSQRVDSSLSLVPLQPIGWNISMVGAPRAWSRNIRGSGVRVAILDTGIARHPDLTISGGVSFVPGVISFNDVNGHGTHVAGTVAARNNPIGVVGVAPSALLYAVQVLKHDPVTGRAPGLISWIIAGMEWCVLNGIKVANMSLGGDSAPLVAFATAVKRCQDNGVTVVVSSGNSFGTAFPWVGTPANSISAGQPNASPIVVGAINSASVIAGFSSRGGQTTPWNQVTCVAPGVSIRSTYLGNGYFLDNGTSMACPHVAGLAALIIQRYPGITPANVKRRITTTCRDLGAFGPDITHGFGLINCDLAIG